MDTAISASGNGTLSAKFSENLQLGKKFITCGAASRKSGINVGNRLGTLFQFNRLEKDFAFKRRECRTGP
jgi:hypothetical protein